MTEENIIIDITMKALHALLDEHEGVVVELDEPTLDGVSLIRVFKDSDGILDMCAAKPGDYVGLRILDATA